MRWSATVSESEVRTCPPGKHAVKWTEKACPTCGLACQKADGIRIPGWTFDPPHGWVRLF
jgi:hypothetical protein